MRDLTNCVIMSIDLFNLERFVTAQDAYDSYNIALKEIKEGRKQSHWIWYVFPQIQGLGHSFNSEYYGIKSIEEASAYIADKLLGQRLREITEALLKIEGKTINEILGGIDAKKARSSMTLFDMVSPHDIFEKVLDKYYAGKRCVFTLKRFAKQ